MKHVQRVAGFWDREARKLIGGSVDSKTAFERYIPNLYSIF